MSNLRTSSRPPSRHYSEEYTSPFGDYTQQPSSSRSSVVYATGDVIPTPGGLPYKFDRVKVDTSYRSPSPPVSWPDGKDFKIHTGTYNTNQQPDSKASDAPFLSPEISRSPGPSVRIVNRQHPWFPHLFEAPNYGMVLWHLFLCVAAFPVIFILPKAAQGLSLTLVRAIVGAICGVVGLMLGYTLIELGRRSFEAAFWATVIHQSALANDRAGLTLDQLWNVTSNPTSLWGAISLLYMRLISLKGAKRAVHRSYDRSPWSVHVGLFIAMAALAALVPFALGRIVIVYTSNDVQRVEFKQVGVFGELSTADLAAAAKQVAGFGDFVRTWTLTSYSSSSQLPRPISLSAPGNNGNGSGTVWFAETFKSQLAPAPQGRGFGTFDFNGTDGTNSPGNAIQNPDELFSSGKAETKDTTGNILRWPRWGVRIKCAVLDNLPVNLVQVSNNSFTYAFVPRETLKPLFGSLGKTMPDDLRVNMTKVLAVNDTLPVGLVPADIAVGVKWWNNGNPFSTYSQGMPPKGADGNGWLYVELVLIRLNTTQTPSGAFGAYGEATPDGSRLGYDVAVCVEVVEPWIVEAYNSTSGSPVSIGIVRRGNSVAGAEDTLHKRQKKNKNLHMNEVVTTLNSTGKMDAWASAHDNSRNMLIKDSSQDFFYSVSPSTVSLTGGSGPLGYTRMQAKAVENTLANADASHLLPYLAGTQMIVAQAFSDQTLAYTRVSVLWLICALLIIAGAGFFAAFTVPKLPFGLPRRDFGVYSMVAAFEGDGLVDPLKPVLDKNMDIDDLKSQAGNLHLRYTV